VPAARRQSGKQRALRRLLIEVEGLGIELAGERLDLRRVDDVPCAAKTPSDGEVLEVEAILPSISSSSGTRTSPALDSYLHNDSD